jgi:hypothetical protein
MDDQTSDASMESARRKGISDDYAANAIRHAGAELRDGALRFITAAASTTARAR